MFKHVANFFSRLGRGAQKDTGEAAKTVGADISKLGKAVVRDTKTAVEDTSHTIKKTGIAAEKDAKAVKDRFDKKRAVSPGDLPPLSK